MFAVCIRWKWTKNSLEKKSKQSSFLPFGIGTGSSPWTHWLTHPPHNHMINIIFLRNNVHRQFVSDENKLIPTTEKICPNSILNGIFDKMLTNERLRGNGETGPEWTLTLAQADKTMEWICMRKTLLLLWIWSVFALWVLEIIRRHTHTHSHGTNGETNQMHTQSTRQNVGRSKPINSRTFIYSETQLTVWVSAFRYGISSRLHPHPSLSHSILLFNIV